MIPEDTNAEKATRGQTAAPPAGSPDLYTVFIAGHEGTRHKSKMVPRGFRDAEIMGATAIVLKPDGTQFANEFPRLGPGTSKGDREQRRAYLLRYLRTVFSKAQIIASGGSDASFHIVLQLDGTAQGAVGNERKRFKEMLEKLRVMAFSDQIGNSLQGSMAARQVGSTNSKTGATVTEVQPASGSYSLEELETLAVTWLAAPEVSLFRAWFGVDGERARCPFHDSADDDLRIGEHLECFGGKHCAADCRTAVIPMVETKSKKGNKPSLSQLLIADDVYRTRWEKTYFKVRNEIVEQEKLREAQKVAAAAGKRLISIDHSTTDDALLEDVRQAISNVANLYCDPSSRLLTLEADRQTQALGIVYHDSTDRFVSLVDRAAVVRTFSLSAGWRYRPLPNERAVAAFHRPELRGGLRVLVRVSKTPVLDLVNLRVQPPGYDQATHVYYDGPEIEIPAGGTTPRLDELLAGWTGMCGSTYRSCKTPSDVAHLYAGVFTEVLADCGLFTLHGHPLVRGNQKGVGKDKYAECLGVLRDGETPVDLNHNDENRINQGFGNGIHAGRRIFQITNISCSGAYGNAMLTRWLTSESLTGPKHGGGIWLINPNTASVVLTINRGSIDHDLLDRLLPINLEVTGDARKRKFGLDPVAYAREHRLEIIGEVLGLALECLREGQEWNIPDGVDRRFERWMKVIGAMIEKKGLTGFMQTDADVEDEVNEDLAAFVDLAGRMYASNGENWMRPKEILELCKSTDPQRRPLFQDLLREGAPERTLSKYVLLRFVGEPVRLLGIDGNVERTVKLRADEDKKSKSTRYRVEVVLPPGQAISPVNHGGDTGGDTLCIGGDDVSLGGDSDSLVGLNVKNDSELAGMAGIHFSSPPASPPIQPIVCQEVKATGGDSGDTPIGGTSGMNCSCENTLKQRVCNHSTREPLRNIPAIPVIPANGDSAPTESTPESSDDPWKGASL